MGTAVLVGVDGKPVVSEQLNRQAINALKRNTRAEDWQQIILVCYDVSAAIGITMPGLQVAAILAQSPAAPSEPPSLPCLVGIEELLKEVDKSVIVMVDASRGVVYVEPDVQTVVAYQSPTRHRPTERRIFIDPGHLPATTLDDRIIQVWGYATTLDEAARAVELGADGVFFAGELASEDDAEALFHTLRGLPLVLSNLPTGDTLTAAIKGSTPGQMRFALKADDLAEGSERILEAYSRAEEGSDLDEDEFDQPGFVVCAPGPEALTPEVIAAGIGAIIFQGTISPDVPAFVAAVREAGALAFAFGQETGELDARMIEAGVDGIIVAAEFVAITKNVVSTLPRSMLPLGG